MQEALKPQPEPHLTLPIFFDRLAQAAIERASKPLDHPGQKSTLSLIVGHAKVLKSESERAPVSRNQPVIRSSWAVVNQYGRELGLFQAFEGESELRRSLVEFLNSGS